MPGLGLPKTATFGTADETGQTAAEIPQGRPNTEAEGPATPAILTANREAEERVHAEDLKKEIGT